MSETGREFLTANGIGSGIGSGIEDRIVNSVRKRVSWVQNYQLGRGQLRVMVLVAVEASRDELETKARSERGTEGRS